MKNFGYGFVAQEPSMREVATSKVCRFRLAVPEYRVQKGEKVEDTHFLDFEVWDTAADYVMKNFERGDCVYVESIPREYKYKTEDRTVSTVVFRVVDFSILRKSPKNKRKEESWETQERDFEDIE